VKKKTGKSDAKAVVRFSSEVAYLVEDIASVTGRRDLAGGGVEFTFRIVDRGWLCLWVLSFLDSAEIISPKSLREDFKKLVETMI